MDTMLASGHGIPYRLSVEIRTNMEIHHTRVYWAKIMVNTIEIDVHFEIFAFLYHNAKFRTEGYGIPYLMSAEIHTNLKIHHIQVCWAKQNGDKIKNYVYFESIHFFAPWDFFFRKKHGVLAYGAKMLCVFEVYVKIGFILNFLDSTKPCMMYFDIRVDFRTLKVRNSVPNSTKFRTMMQKCCAFP